MTDNSKIEIAHRAISKVLDRAQTDADLGYLVGPFTETFRLLCEAEAALTGTGMEEVTTRRSPSLAREPRRLLTAREHQEGRGDR